MHSAQLQQASLHLRRTADTVLLNDCGKWAAKERGTTAMLIAHIAEVGNRRLFRDQAPSLYAYCEKVLRLDEGGIWRRLQVAGCCTRVPKVLTALSEGRITLSVAAILAPLLTTENAEHMLAAVAGKTKREVEELVADMNPKEPSKAGIRKYGSAAAATQESGFDFTPASESDPLMTPPAPRSPKIIPLGQQRYALSFSFDAIQKAKLTRLGELLGINPHGKNLALLVERAFDIALKAKDPAKKGTSKPRADSPKKQPPSHSRYIAAALKRSVLERAAFCCQHKSSDGLRCNEKSLLQIDHVHPLSWGGTTSLNNLQALCPGHHRLKTEVQQGTWVQNTKL